ncbi:hypothetical protein B0H17DRAFT_84448 [Mycena rosella]|uniref:Homeobox domain-containing protein n=1 Tax=Mycena rosella TaxID=1033263 RepID=A0AAD7GQC9_MYCRO|nr:hypothetical protein B0H17DRAFT_84448 [Mycena rosella]
MIPRLPHPLSAHPYSPTWSRLPPMPHGMDPTDYRAFYPYTPNEVKHRKRTTSAQLKVLEGVFKRDTKPNAALRTELAAQLNMTARGVQVWFQNRRAKEKTKASKGVLKSALAKHIDSPSPRSSEDADACESPSELLPELSTSASPSPTGTDPPRLHVVTDSADSSWQGSPVIQSPEDSAFDLPSIHMFGRRGSLPVNAFNHTGYGPPLVDPLDPLARRRSVDASLVRLASNPYANLARAKNNALLATQRLSHGRQHHSRMTRPGMPHRSTVPMQHTRHTSMDARGYRIPPSPSPSPLSPYHAVRASLPDHHLYPVSSRTISAPIPGPLPSPGFSFGMANASPDSNSNRNSPVDFSGFSFPRNDADTEDDGSASSYQMSRFSSIASESSATSAYFSDVGSAGEPPDFSRNLRRESCPTGFLNLMSGLDVGPRRASLAEGLIGNYSAQSDGGERGAAGYPSPSSTVSPGSSPHLSGNGTGVPVSNSSELNYALKHEDLSYPPRSAGGALDMGNADAAESSTFFFDANNSNGNYDYGMPTRRKPRAIPRPRTTGRPRGPAWGSTRTWTSPRPSPTTSRIPSATPRSHTHEPNAPSCPPVLLLLYPIAPYYTWWISCHNSPLVLTCRLFHQSLLHQHAHSVSFSALCYAKRLVIFFVHCLFLHSPSDLFTH